FEVAALLKLNNLENQEQKELLEATLKELTSDDLWDENNAIERTNKKMKLKRYHFDKYLGTRVDKAEEDMDTLQGEQDMTKWTKKHGVPLLDMDSGPSASIQLAAVKVEHMWVVPAEDLKNNLANSQKQVRILVSTFKRLRGLFGSASDGYEEEKALCLAELALLEKVEADLIQCGFANPRTMDETSGKDFVEQGTSLLKTATDQIAKVEISKRKLAVSASKLTNK
ncbi:unnamed protein product, partial [Effrenium voratum]